MVSVGFSIVGRKGRQLDQIGIRPLWFAPEHFTQIESLLREALERSSTRQLSRVTASPRSLSDSGF